MIPIGQLYDDIRIEISWEANSQAAVWSAVPTGTYSVLDCQLELQIIELRLGYFYGSGTYFDTYIL